MICQVAVLAVPAPSLSMSEKMSERYRAVSGRWKTWSSQTGSALTFERLGAEGLASELADHGRSDRTRDNHRYALPELYVSTDRPHSDAIFGRAGAALPGRLARLVLSSTAK
jgi:hypothetical protein